MSYAHFPWLPCLTWLRTWFSLCVCSSGLGSLAAVCFLQGTCSHVPEMQVFVVGCAVATAAHGGQRSMSRREQWVGSLCLGVAAFLNTLSCLPREISKFSSDWPNQPIWKKNSLNCAVMSHETGSCLVSQGEKECFPGCGKGKERTFPWLWQQELTAVWLSIQVCEMWDLHCCHTGREKQMKNWNQLLITI